MRAEQHMLLKYVLFIGNNVNKLMQVYHRRCLHQLDVVAAVGTPIPLQMMFRISSVLLRPLKLLRNSFVINKMVCYLG